MCKVIIAGPKGLRGKTVTHLYDLGVLHIKDYVKSSDEEILDIGTPSIRAASDSEYLIKLRSIKKHLKIDSTENTKKTEHETSNVFGQIDDIDSKIVTFIDKIKEQNDLLSIIDSKEKIVAPVSKLGLDWKVFSEYGSLSYMVGYLPKNVDISTLKKDGTYTEGDTVSSVSTDTIIMTNGHESNIGVTRQYRVADNAYAFTEASDSLQEPQPNGGRINMGAYGGTGYASMSSPYNTCDLNRDGYVDFLDLVFFADKWLME